MSAQLGSVGQSGSGTPPAAVMGAPQADRRSVKRRGADSSSTGAPAAKRPRAELEAEIESLRTRVLQLETQLRTQVDLLFQMQVVQQGQSQVMWGILGRMLPVHQAPVMFPSLLGPPPSGIPAGVGIQTRMAASVPPGLAPRTRSDL